MTFEILTNPTNSQASLLFQQCLAEIVPENKLIQRAKDEVSGYFLDKIVPTDVSDDLWMKVINSNETKKKSHFVLDIDPFLSQLPRTLQAHLLNKKINWVLNFKYISKSDDLKQFLGKPIILSNDNILISTENSFLN